MIVLDCEQGSQEWLEARLGIPTASEFDKIITGTGKPSSQASTYMNKLLAEWMTGKSNGMEQTDWMQRGNELEADARMLYTLTTDIEVETVGLVYKDDRKLVSCSPDGLSEGGLELKCPAPHTHVEYLLSGKIPTKYIPQVQGAMYITDRQWWDFMSYHPEMPPLLVRVERNDKYIDALDLALSGFIERMLWKRGQLSKIGEHNDAAA